MRSVAATNGTASADLEVEATMPGPNIHLLPEVAHDPTTPPADRLAAVQEAAQHCQACPLWQLGRQTVFGSGPANARLMVVGEAPGEQEDRQGTPLVGPAGKLFNEAIAQAGLDRQELYLTNTVKHRPWVEQRGRPKNRAPRQSEIKACRPWLEQQLEIIRPELVVCLGATAAHALLGREFRLTEQRGRWLDGPAGTAVLATVHPAYVLIQPAETAAQVRQMFFGDIQMAAERYRMLTSTLVEPGV
jgi:uracil-DNA glycosylase